MPVSTERNYGIVSTDSFGGDYPNEKWIITPWLRASTAAAIADLLNNEFGEDSRRYYKIEKGDYKLAPGFEP